MKRMAVILSTTLLISGLAGCSGVTKQDVGTVTGGVLGGVLGHSIGGGSGKLLATVGGTLIGAYIGGSIGQSMDQVDQMKWNRAIESNPVGQTSTWQNPDTGASYSVQPKRTYYKAKQPCRDFTTSAVIGGENKVVHGTACRQPDGTWRIVK